MSATLVLVRHGETAWNAEGRLQGQTDIPLNDVGREQAYVAGQELAGSRWDVLASSTLGRAVETAELIGQNLGLVLTEKIGGLQERHYGNAEGRVASGLPREEIDVLLRSAEPEEAVAARGIRSLCELLERHEGKRIVVVAHGTLIRLTVDALVPGRKTPIMRNGQMLEVDIASLRRHAGAPTH
ncbi:histidine phosphatase family protein [Paeniglutamicibacter sp. NPDC091659]|uniref:histidine phosphatase family protein n=1 Tax=Paeniglutamicibacter sp. NPDC091659 TaxID=3364389 RepID=UPI00382F989A